MSGIFNHVRLILKKNKCDRFERICSESYKFRQEKVKATTMLLI